jgi:phosphohistidine swiveling domain-containing protein
MTQIIGFDHDAARDPSVVGGKAANLGRLHQAGFPVPPGFTIGTETYRDFVRAGGLGDRILELVREAGDAPESAATAVRDLVGSAEMADEVAGAIRSAYRDLGAGVPVAVRSSGTAEDLDEASFAGQHDTYLHINGEEQVLDAVRRCWASLWSARAVAYRATRGIDPTDVSIAVTVQQLVDAEVAGVLFTANPLTTATDEFVVNATWGLGESLVSGLVTPDEFVLDRDTVQVRRSTLGTKEVRSVRDDGNGTRTEPTPDDERAVPSLSADQLATLGQIGRAIADEYGGFPTDIEWALADGRFSILQARRITGVEFTWDEDLESFHPDPEVPTDIYTRAWSDDFSIGAITPLYYTTRTKEQEDCYRTAQTLYGHHDVAARRSVKYHKGEQYYNASAEAMWIPKILPPALRNGGSMSKIPPSWWADTAAKPFSWLEYAKIYARIALLDKRVGPYRYVASFRERMADQEAARGLSDDQLPRLSDRALRRYVEEKAELHKRSDDDQWSAFFFYSPVAMGYLGVLLGKWYDGDAGQAFVELLSGLAEPSITLVENHELWRLGEKIKASPVLRKALEEHAGQAFLDELRTSEEGRAFLAEYEPWRQKRGHRGSADRDILLPRRLDDPMIDYNMFRTLIAADTEDPLTKEIEHRETRRRREDEVYAAIRRGPLGHLRLELFKLLQSWSLGFMAHRDDEREFLDLLAYTLRRSFLEIGRRLVERGLIAERDDVFFLGLEENFELLETGARAELARAKISGRKRAYERRRAMEITLPPYLHTWGTPALPGELIGAIRDDDTSSADGATTLTGTGTSSGTVTGTARVLKDMSLVGTLRDGDILVCYATDPGWTPAFLVIDGLVMQVGGVLAHGSCLSREYGLPAVVVPEAVRRIPDGARITVNGSTGSVVIHEVEPVAIAS